MSDKALELWILCWEDPDSGQRYRSQIPDSASRIDELIALNGRLIPRRRFWREHYLEQLSSR